MRSSILTLFCVCFGASLFGGSLDDESRRLGDMIDSPSFNAAAFERALSKSPLGERENIDYRSYMVSTLLARAGYAENIPAMKSIISHGADIEQIVHKEKNHDLIVVLLSVGKFKAAAYLYSLLPPESLRRRDEGLDKRAEEAGKGYIKGQAYEAEVWAKREPELMKQLKEARSFTWKDFLKLVMAVGGSL
jgi:hypothetical protein